LPLRRRGRHHGPPDSRALPKWPRPKRNEKLKESNGPGQHNTAKNLADARVTSRQPIRNSEQPPAIKNERQRIIRQIILPCGQIPKTGEPWKVKSTSEKDKTAPKCKHRTG